MRHKKYKNCYLKADIAGAPMQVYSTSRMASNLASRSAIEMLTSTAHKICFAAPMLQLRQSTLYRTGSLCDVILTGINSLSMH